MRFISAWSHNCERALDQISHQNRIQKYQITKYHYTQILPLIDKGTELKLKCTQIALFRYLLPFSLYFDEMYIYNSKIEKFTYLCTLAFKIILDLRYDTICQKYNPSHFIEMEVIQQTNLSSYHVTLFVIPCFLFSMWFQKQKVNKKIKMKKKTNIKFASQKIN